MGITMQSEPVLVGLLFADQVIEEQGTNKKTIVGVFTQFHSATFPVQFPPWWIYVALDNVSGTSQFALNLVHDATEQIVVAISGQIDVKDSPDGIEMHYRIPSAVFPSPGMYNLTLKIDGHQVGSRVLKVTQIKRSGA